MKLLEELKRRKVFRVGAAYLVAAWLVIQVADILLENYGAPEWVFQTLGVVMLLGFPVACALAWAFDVVPGGETADAAGTSGSDRWIVPVLAILLIGVLAERFVIADKSLSGIDEPGTLQAEVGSVRPSIAVLPFENFSASQDQSYFSDGLADTILHRLAQLQDVRVIARNSSFVYKGGNVDVREVGRELDVQTVLEGSVQRQGDQLRVIAQLVETATGSHLWSGTFDTQMNDIFRVQDEIALAVADGLSLELLGEELSALRTAGTKNPQALDLLLKIKQEMSDAEDDVSLEITDDWLSQVRAALRLDPDYPAAWTLLANIYNSRAFRADDREMYETSLEQMRQAIQRAMMLEPGSTEALMAYATYLRRTGQSVEALTVALTVLKEMPNNSDALSMVGLSYLNNFRYKEAFDYFTRAREIDPFSPFNYRQRAMALQGLGRMTEAEQVLRDGIDRFPDFPLFKGMLASVRRAQGDHLGSLEVSLDDGDDRTVCEALLWFERTDLFEAMQCMALERSDGLAFRQLVYEGKYAEANRQNQADAIEDDEEEWRSRFTLYCYLAGDVDCALKHSAAGFEYQLDDLGLADYHNYDIARALSYHALAQLKWGEQKVLAREVLERTLEVVQARPMHSYQNCTLCGQANVRAEVLAVLGDREAALDALEASLPDDNNRVYLNSLLWNIRIDRSPLLETLRQEPRYVAVMQEAASRRQAIAAQLDDLLEKAGRI